MNRVSVMFLAIAVLITMVPTVQAGSIRFQYKLAPDQVWIGTMSSQSETTFMGKKDINRTKSIIEYRISKGPKPGWVSLTAKIRSQKSHSGQTGGQMDLSKITFFADMHPSGDIRNIRHEGNPMPPPDPSMPPEMKAMVAQSSNMMADAWKNAVFWFPELPEEALVPGDEFDVTRKMGMGGSGMGMQSQTISKQVFTLEEVADGLAYFTVKDRSITKTEGVAGGTADTKTAGKGETVFDMESGMWTDMTVKSRSKVNMSGVPGMANMSQEVLSINKYEMEQK